jgi:hypothetical protein
VSRPGALRLLIPAALAAALLALPAAAPAAAVHSFVNTDDLFPSGNANGLVGPANEYPSTIEVTGVEGTVTKVTADIVGLHSGRPEDIDMALENPDGEVTMLMSDACGGETHGFSGNDWTFDDAAPTFLSQLGCMTEQTASFKPTNFGDPADDDLSVKGGPEGPYGNTLAALAGGEPDGEWNLYVVDDTEDIIGFTINAWVLKLEVEPPPPVTPTPPAPIVVTAPVLPTAALPAPATPAPAAAKTGKRAKALARCKTKKTHKARQACKQRARKLPL